MAGSANAGVARQTTKTYPCPQTSMSINRNINEVVSSDRLPRMIQATKRPELISAQARDLLNLQRLPAMLNVQQTAVMLGVGEHDIPVLLRAGLLKPLGNPPANAVKYFASFEVLELAGECGQLSRMRDAIYGYWQGKNAAKIQPRQQRNNGRP
jgi:hypothetical protein